MNTTLNNRRAIYEEAKAQFMEAKKDALQKLFDDLQGTDHRAPVKLKDLREQSGLTSQEIAWYLNRFEELKQSCLCSNLTFCDELRDTYIAYRTKVKETRKYAELDEDGNITGNIINITRSYPAYSGTY